MTTLTLQRYKLRGTKLVPQRDAVPEDLDWPKLVERLAPSGSTYAMLLLRHAKPGEFVGTRTRDGQPSAFKIAVPGGQIRSILKAQPTFGSDLLEVYRVERTQWDASMTEPPSEVAAR